MNISLLTKYNSYSYPAHSLAKSNSVRNAPALPVYKNTENESVATGIHKSINYYSTSSIKRVGYTEVNGLWDQFTVSRFVDLIQQNTGSTIDAGAIMRRYDLDGDGLLDLDEQTAMIEGLSKAEYHGEEISQSVIKSIIEQLKEMSGQERKYVSELQSVAKMYERLFLFEFLDAEEEAAKIAV